MIIKYDIEFKNKISRMSYKEECEYVNELYNTDKNLIVVIEEEDIILLIETLFTSNFPTRLLIRSNQIIVKISNMIFYFKNRNSSNFINSYSEIYSWFMINEGFKFK